jgi:hypothetical protein
MSAITFDYTPHTQNSRYSHVVRAWLGNSRVQRVGILMWDSVDGKITWVEVEKPFTRRGIATRMLSFAREVSPVPVVHCNLATASGRAWAEATP